MVNLVIWQPDWARKGSSAWMESLLAGLRAVTCTKLKIFRKMCNRLSQSEECSIEPTCRTGHVCRGIEVEKAKTHQESNVGYRL